MEETKYIINTEQGHAPPLSTGWSRWVVELYEAEVGEAFPFTADEIANLADITALQNENPADPKTLLVSLACELARHHTQDNSMGSSVYFNRGEYFDDVIPFIRQYGWFRVHGSAMTAGPLSAMYAHHYVHFSAAMARAVPGGRPTHPMIRYEEVGKKAFSHANSLMCVLAKLELGADIFVYTDSRFIPSPSLFWTGRNMMA